MKIALYRDPEDGHDAAFQVSTLDPDFFAGRPRVSEIVEVELPYLPPDQVRAAELQALDRLIGRESRGERLMKRREQLLVGSQS